MESSRPRWMLFRFSLYGFLKNQQYYDPFLILFFRTEHDLSFLKIGLLVAFREILVNLLEVPSGALADLYGRRRAMVMSLGSYIISFLIFARSTEYWHLFAAMFLFSVGEVFRTGTHKAMIFDWLKREGMEKEKTRVYGYTRSWSKIGSALAAIIAPVAAILTGNFRDVFYFSALVYALGIANMLSYPRYLDGTPRKFSLKRVFATLLQAFKSAFACRFTRRLLVEAMCFDGLYKANKDYMQPVLMQLALGLPVLLWMNDGGMTRTKIIVGAAYFLLNIVSAAASRNAHQIVKKGEERGGRILWLLYGLTHLALVPAFFYGYHLAAVAGFLALAVLQNFWRPTLIARVASRTDNSLQATVLSIESQSRSLFVAGAAPLTGYLVDRFAAWARTTGQSNSFTFLPIALTGIVVSGLMLLTGNSPDRSEEEGFDTSAQKAV